MFVSAGFIAAAVSSCSMLLPTACSIKRHLMLCLTVEFLALKSKSTAVPGDALDVAALHAALDCKDKSDTFAALRFAATESMHGARV